MYKEQIVKHIQDSVDAKQRLLENDALLAQIDTIASVLVKAYKSGHKAIWAGNGGSAADAQHMAGELVSKFFLERPGLPSIALNVNTSVLTAVGNDYCYDRVFAKQMEAFGQAWDVFIGISTSGNSKNLLEAKKVCEEKGVVTVALVGEKPCKMDDWDYVLHLPSTVTPRIQECQTLVGHILCYLVEQQLFG